MLTQCPLSVLAFLSAAVLSGCEGRDQQIGLPVRQLESVQRIDGAANDLVPIDWVAVSDDEMLAVAQRQDASVLLFRDSVDQGERVGKSGDGPGEFRDVSSGGWVADTMWVADAILHRLSLVTSRGRLVRTLALPPIVPGETASRFRNAAYSVVGVTSGDTLLAHVPPPPADKSSEATMDGGALVLLSREGALERVATYLPVDRGRVEIHAEGFSPGSTMRTPFFAVPLWSSSLRAKRIVIAESRFHDDQTGEYVVTSVRTNGDTVFTRVFPFTSVAIPASQMDSALHRLFPPNFAGAADLRQQLQAPHAFPPLERIVVGADASVWIGLRAEGRVRPWLVLDSTGQVVGRVTLETDQLVWDARQSKIWTTLRDRDGVESVVVYRMR